jgi:heptosyltransferase II
MTELKKILIIAPAWVGDLVMAQSLFKIIKINTSATRIEVLANKNLHPILKSMPEVDECLDLPFKHGECNWLERYKLGKSLRSRNYDQAIVLPNSFKSALIPYWAKIPQRTGWRGEMRYILLNDLRILDKQKLPLMIERFIALGLKKDESLPAVLPWPLLETTSERVQKTLEKLVIAVPQQPILALCPGAEYGPAKRWPAAYYAKVAKTKVSEGFQVWIFGGPGDKKVAEEIQAFSGNVALDFTGKTDLGEAVDLMSLASVVLTNDSGLMHVAAALAKPVVAIYGSSSPKFTPPLATNVQIVSLNLSCSPCFKRDCPLEHMRCLYELKPETILKTLETINSCNL